MQISIYCDVIKGILKRHKELSVNKMLVFAYLLKKERFMPGRIYNGNNTQDIVCKSISLLSGDYDEYCNSIQYIIKAIHLLVNDGTLQLQNSLLMHNSDTKSEVVICHENMFIEKAIEASKKITDRQFLREVTYNV